MINEGCCGDGCGHEHEKIPSAQEAVDAAKEPADAGAESVITMTDTETGESFQFTLADDFSFQDEHYCVLVTSDPDDDPEMILVKVVKMDDGSEGLMSLEEEEYERALAEYERLCEEEMNEEEETQ